MGLFDFLKPKQTQKQSPDLKKQMQKIALAAFPGGEKQIQEETGQLYALSRGKLTKDEAKRLLTRTKAILTISKDKSKERIVPSIIASTGNKLTPHEGFLAYQFFTGVSGDIFAGGDGSSTEQAVVINATSSLVGIDAEYKWIESRYGALDKDWIVEMRMHGGSDEGKSYETFHIKLSDGTSKAIVFDISSFYCRF
jgi:hypothetical protein